MPNHACILNSPLMKTIKMNTIWWHSYILRAMSFCLNLLLRSDQQHKISSKRNTYSVSKHWAQVKYCVLYQRLPSYTMYLSVRIWGGGPFIFKQQLFFKLLFGNKKITQEDPNLRIPRLNFSAYWWSQWNHPSFRDNFYIFCCFVSKLERIGHLAPALCSWYWKTFQ